MSYQTSIIIWGKWLFDQNIPSNCRILHLKEFYIFLKKVNNDAKSLFNCSNKNKTNKQKIKQTNKMGHKTQNGDLIISYSKFVNLKFMDQSQSLLGWFSEIFTNFLILLIFFFNFCLSTQKNMSIELLVEIFYGLKPLTIFSKSYILLVWLDSFWIRLRKFLNASRKLVSLYLGFMQTGKMSMTLI